MVENTALLAKQEAKPLLKDRATSSAEQGDQERRRTSLSKRGDITKWPRSHSGL